MTDKKQTMYEMLGISQTATLPEIKAAHHRLTRALVSSGSGLAQEEVNHKLQVLDLALNTLSVQWSRDAYDAQLAALNPSANIASPALNVMKVPQGAVFNPLQVAVAIEDTRRLAVSSKAGHPVPLAVMSATVSSSVSALRAIFRVFGGLLVLGIVIFTSMRIAESRGEAPYPEMRAMAEEKVIIQDYYHKYGVRPASRAEAEALELENRRQANAQHIAELQRKKQEEDYARFVEQSRRDGEQITNDLQRAEESARYEEERKRREAAWAQQRAEQRPEEDRAPPEE
ncbi:MAG TPA: hypothetical protein VLS47_06230 [Gallionella sp.]|nr:hypothetical protein [Gallionella sp.]